MAKESPLKELHRANGAHFVEEDGWVLPGQFGDVIEEYQCVRSRVGLLDHCNRGVFCASGPDRVSFLQGMVSNDLKPLAPGQGVEITFLNIQGKMLADAKILCMKDFFLVILGEPLTEKIISHLNRYLVADEVEIADWTPRYSILSAQGPRAGDFIRELLQENDLPAKSLEHQACHFKTSDVWVVRYSHTGEGGYDLLVERKDLLSLATRCEEVAKHHAARWIGLQAQEILRVESGIPRYGVDMTEENLLLETGLDHAVNFHKGCYLGQEVVERIRSRGHVNKKLAGLVLTGETLPERNTPVLAKGKEIGMITSCVFSPARKCPLALAYLNRDYLQPGTRVAILDQGAQRAAEVSALPFS